MIKPAKQVNQPRALSYIYDTGFTATEDKLGEVGELIVPFGIGYAEVLKLLIESKKTEEG